MNLRKAGIAFAESVIGDVDMKFQQSILWFLETPTSQIMYCRIFWQKDSIAFNPVLQPYIVKLRELGLLLPKA